jgi:predicted ATPase
MAAQERPILVLIDDLQWVDRESAVVLLFAARRMRHDAVLFLLARREGSVEPDVAGLDELELVGLTAAESAPLLSQRSTAPVVLAQLVDRTAGNPLAMLEAAQQLSAEQLRGRRRADLSAPVDQERRVATGKPG